MVTLFLIHYYFLDITNYDKVPYFALFWTFTTSILINNTNCSIKIINNIATEPQYITDIQYFIDDEILKC